MTRLHPLWTLAAALLQAILGAFPTAAEAASLSVQALADREVEISWPSTAGEAVLEESATLGPTESWQPVGKPVAPRNDRMVVIVEAVEAARYFRLSLSGPGPLTTLQTVSPPSGANGVSVNRDTYLEFSAPLAADTVVPGNGFFAEFGGRRLLSRTEISHERRRATLFYLEPLPAGARIRVTFEATNVRDVNGREVDADGDGLPGGRRETYFDTFSATPVASAAVIGRVFASDPEP